MKGLTGFYWLPYVCLGLVCITVGGCALTGQRNAWRPPTYARPDRTDPAGHSTAAAEAAYAAAVEAETHGSDACVDYYFEAATHSWLGIERNLAASGFASPRTMNVNRSAVTKLLVTAQRFGRWRPGTGIEIRTAGTCTLVPTQFSGFAWQPQEFQHLEPVGDFTNKKLSRRFRSDGIGVPLVVLRHTRCPQPFTQERQAFAATALVRHCGGAWRLELCNPLNCTATTVATYGVPLAREFSAPFAFANQERDRLWMTNFLRPDSDGSQNRLLMIEPYQQGKIPVVFVHGLLSDPKTWVDLVNELRAHPDLSDNCQWWAYRYATGGPFLESAAGLRRQLAQLRSVYDPHRTDPAMSQIVLIGHSMGGLISKLQVTESGDRLWRSIATQPLSSVRTTPEVRQRLHENFFFSPSCDVSRVVFIGTPHQGSPWARRPVGRLASAMVKPSAETRASFEQLVNDNPHLLQGIDSNRFPTSIDLLESRNPVLRATATLPYASHVSLHSIVGVARSTWGGEASDGVVPASSARLLGVQSEHEVDAKHTELHRDPASIDQIAAILREHLRRRVVTPQTPVIGHADSVTAGQRHLTYATSD